MLCDDNILPLSLACQYSPVSGAALDRPGLSSVRELDLSCGATAEHDEHQGAWGEAAITTQSLPDLLPAHSARNSLRLGLVTLKEPQRPPAFLTLFMAAVAAEFFSAGLQTQPRILQPPAKARRGLHWRGNCNLIEDT